MKREYVITMSPSDRKAIERIMKETLDKLSKTAEALPIGKDRDEAWSFVRKFTMVKENLFGGN